METLAETTSKTTQTVGDSDILTETKNIFTKLGDEFEQTKDTNQRLSGKIDLISKELDDAKSQVAKLNLERQNLYTKEDVQAMLLLAHIQIGRQKKRKKEIEDLEDYVDKTPLQRLKKDFATLERNVKSQSKSDKAVQNIENFNKLIGATNKEAIAKIKEVYFYN